MAELWQSLLRMRGFNAADAFVRFEFATGVQLWHWPVIALVCAGVAIWMYRHSQVRPALRTLLIALRTALLLLLVVLLMGPRLVRTSEIVEPDTVIVLLDRSASMNVRDVAPGPSASGAASAGSRQTRDEQLAAAMRAAQAVMAEQSAQRRVLVLGFDASVAELGANLAVVGSAGTALAPAVGPRTDLAAALEAAITKAAGRPLAGIIVASDGRLSTPVPRSTLRKLEAARVGIFPVPLGSATAAQDIAVRSVESTGGGFINDTIPVRVELLRSGSSSTPSDGVDVELVDAASGRVLDTRRARFEPSARGGDGTAAITLVGAAETAGKRPWIVRIKPAADDLIAENNSAQLDIDLTDRPLRVLQLDGYPRWEYRYLKNLLARESTMKFASLLLSPGRRYIQEGTTEMTSLPTVLAGPDGWDSFDVILLGDIKPEAFTTEQLAQIRTRVAEGGAGLFFIAGSSALPDAWFNTPLGDLLPFIQPTGGIAARLALPASGITSASRSRNMPLWDRDVTMRPTLLAERLSVLRLADVPTSSMGSPSASGAGGESPPASPATEASMAFWNPQVSDPASGWSRLRWAQRIERTTLKPAAEILAEAVPVPRGAGPAGPDGAGAPAADPSAEPSALLTTMRFGSGRVMYLATDEIWRYRYGRGEDLPERFWVQLIRLLGRDAGSRAGRTALLEAAPLRPTLGQVVNLKLTLVDQAAIDAAPTSVRVLVRSRESVASAQAEVLAQVELLPDASNETAESSGVNSNRSTDSSRGQRTFSGTWVPSRAGTVLAGVDDVGLTARGEIATEITVTTADDEMRRPEADHLTLSQLASATGGQMILPTDLSKWPEVVPKREIRQTSIAEQRTLWDTPLALLLVVLLLTTEWVLRRWVRLF